MLALTLFLAAYRIAVMVCPPPRASLSAPPPFPIPRSDYPPNALPIRTSLDRVLAFASGVIDVVGSALAASWALRESRNRFLLRKGQPIQVRISLTRRLSFLLTLTAPRILKFQYEFIVMREISR